MTIASKPHIPFLWGIFLRLDSSSSCCGRFCDPNYLALLGSTSIKVCCLTSKIWKRFTIHNRNKNWDEKPTTDSPHTGAQLKDSLSSALFFILPLKLCALLYFAKYHATVENVVIGSASWEVAWVQLAIVVERRKSRNFSRGWGIIWKNALFITKLKKFSPKAARQVCNTENLLVMNKDIWIQNINRKSFENGSE